MPYQLRLLGGFPPLGHAASGSVRRSSGSPISMHRRKTSLSETPSLSASASISSRVFSDTMVVIGQGYFAGALR